MQLNYLIAPSYFDGGTIYLRLDDPKGPSIATIEINPKLLEMGLKSVSANLEETSGVHDLYMSFESAGDKAVCAPVSLVFSNKAGKEAI